MAAAKDKRPARKAAATTPPTKIAAKRSAKAAAKQSAKVPAKVPTQTPSKKASVAKPAEPKKNTKPATKLTAAAKPARIAAAKPTVEPTLTPATKAATKAVAKPLTKTAMTTVRTTKSEPVTVGELPKPKFNKDGIGYTKDFDLPFVKKRHESLVAERIRLTGQATRLENEAKQMIDEAEMGDVQFDDEGGEGDTMVVERERDLALSAQAREAVIEIDEALARINAGTYGYSVMSGVPLSKERLEAIPWAAISVEEKVGGIGRR